MPQPGQEATHKPATKSHENAYEAGFKFKSIVNEKHELNTMAEDIDPHTIGMATSWANKDIADA